MEYTTLNNGIKMPMLGLGTWDLNGQECRYVVCEAIKLGYRLIDTAAMYGNEKEVGQGIKDSGIDRQELFITTKIDRRFNSYQKAKQAIENALEKLQLEYIDLLLLHEPYPQGSDMYRALEEAYHDHKIRAIGISNYDQRWFESLKYTVIPTVNQVEAHIFYQKWSYQDYLTNHQVHMQAWAPLANGKNNVFNHPIIKQIADQYHKTTAQIMLRFLVQRGISVIPKSRKKERLIENLDIFDFQLTDDDIQLLHQIDQDETLYAWTKSF